MTWLGVVFYLLTHFGDILDLVRKFLDLIHGMPQAERDALKEQVMQMKANGDKAGIRDLIHKTCTGVGCPTDLKDLG